MALQKRILNSKLMIILLLLAFFPPGYLYQNEVVKFALNALKLAGFLLIFFFFMTDIKKHLKKPFIVLLLVLWAELLLSTLLSKNASLYHYAVTALPILGSCFLIGEVATHSPYAGLKSMYIYFSACVIINTTTFLLYPNAMYADVGGYRCWFLGDDNTGYSYYIVASTLAMAFCAFQKKRFTVLSLCVWASSYIFAFGREIGSGKICQFVWSFLFLIYQFNWIKNTIKARYVLYVAVGGFLVLVAFRSSIIEPIALAIGKTVTLSGRTIIWDNLLRAMSARSLLGFGICVNEEFARIVHTRFWSAHNYILQILFWGGISATVLIPLLIFFSYKGSKKIYTSNYCKCLIIGVVVVSVRLLVENGASEHFYLLLTLLAYSNEIVPALQRMILKKRKKHIISSIKFSRMVVKNARS